jgi:hypothetical protein
MSRGKQRRRRIARAARKGRAHRIRYFIANCDPSQALGTRKALRIAPPDAYLEHAKRTNAAWHYLLTGERI